jgi:DNA-binding transcriptional LysR family regulator
MFVDSAHHVLTPETLAMLQLIATEGSFAKAARALDLVPSTLTYRVRQIEDALDVLLFNRQSRQAKLTPAAEVLLLEGARVLEDIHALSNRIKRIATGWESQLHIALDSLIDRQTVLELCSAFYDLKAPTRIKFSDETLSGTLHALTMGEADLAIGTIGDLGHESGLDHKNLGQIEFVFVTPPKHPLTLVKKPLSDIQIRAFRAVAVADSTPKGQGVTVGLLGGQEVLTVPSMQTKLQAHLLGLGVGFLPLSVAMPYIKSSQLVVCEVERPTRFAKVSYAWRREKSLRGEIQNNKALKWWLEQLEKPATQKALLGKNHKNSLLNHQTKTKAKAP